MKGGSEGSRKQEGGGRADNVYALDFQSAFFFFAPARKFRFKGVLLAGRSKGFFSLSLLLLD